MALHFICPNASCQTSVSVADESSDQPVYCPRCGTLIISRASLAAPTQAPSSPTKSRPSGESVAPLELPAEFGRYRLLSLLGRGGMGAVYLAEDTQLGRRVALKLPSFDAGADPQRVERFVREARAAAALHHPHICTVFDAGQWNGRPFISMAYVDGVTLDARIRSEPPLSTSDAVRIARQIAEALQVAHENGVIHRDLKPGNIMLNSRGEPVVMDFGLAKLVVENAEDLDREAKLTHDGAVLGTPRYMAPEQVRGEQRQVGVHTDVFALGVLLFEMIAGRAPFVGTAGVIMSQILHESPPKLGQFRPDTDEQLDAICRRAMAKRPEDRFATMTDFANALVGYWQTASSVGWSKSITVDLPPSGSTVESVTPSPHASRESVPVADSITPRRPRLWWVAGATGALIALAAMLGLTGGLNSFFAERTKGENRESTATSRSVAEPDAVASVTEDSPGTADTTIESPDKTAAEPPSTPLVGPHALRRESIPSDVLKFLGVGNPSAVAPELVGVLGAARGRLPLPNWPKFTPDGRQLAIPCGHELWFVDWATQEVDRVLKISTLPGPIHRIYFSPDGKLVACRFMFTNGVAVYDLESGKARFATSGYVLAWSKPFVPNSQGLLAVDVRNNDVVVLSMADGSVSSRLSLVADYDEGLASCPAPDGNSIVVVTAGKITQFSLPEFSIARQVPFEAPNENRIVEFDTAGRRLLVAGNVRCTVFDWPSFDVVGNIAAHANFATFDRTGERVWLADHGIPEYSVGAARCYDFKTGHEIRRSRLEGQSAWGWWAASPAKDILVGCNGSESLRASQINLDTGAVSFPDIGHTNGLRAIAVSPDGQIAATGGADSTVRVWDLTTGNERHRFRRVDGIVQAIWFSRDGSRIGANDSRGEVMVWSSAGTEVCRFSLRLKQNVPCFSADGSQIFAGLDDGSVGCFDVGSGQLARQFGPIHDSPSSHAVCALSPDGRTLAVGGNHHQVALIDLESGQVSSRLATQSGTRQLQFSHDGRRLFASQDPGRPLRSWLLETGEPLDFFQTAAVNSFAVQPFGSLLAISKANGEETLSWYDQRDPQAMDAVVPGSRNGVCSHMIFTPDGKHLLATGKTGLVCVFRVPSGEEESGRWLSQKVAELGRPPRKQLFAFSERALSSKLLEGKVLYDSKLDGKAGRTLTAPAEQIHFESERYRLRNSAGLRFFVDRNTTLMDTTAEVPGEFPGNLVIDLTARMNGDADYWYVLVREGQNELQVRVDRNVFDLHWGRVGRWGETYATFGLPRREEANPARQVVLVLRGARVDLYVDGRTQFNPVYLERPLKQVAVSVHVVGRPIAELEVERLTVRAAPPDE